MVNFCAVEEVGERDGEVGERGEEEGGVVVEDEFAPSACHSIVLVK